MDKERENKNLDLYSIGSWIVIIILGGLIPSLLIIILSAALIGLGFWTISVSILIGIISMVLITISLWSDGESDINDDESYIKVVPHDTLIFLTPIFFGGEEDKKTGMKPYFILESGAAVIPPWVSTKNPKALNYGRDLFATAKFSVFGSDGSRLDGTVKCPVSADPLNPTPFIRTEKTIPEREKEIQEFLETSLTSTAARIGSEYTPKELLTDKEKLTEFVSKLQKAFEPSKDSDSDFDKSLSKEGCDLEGKFGIQIGPISVGDLKPDDETEKAMKQEAIIKFQQKAADALVKWSESTPGRTPITPERAMQIVLANSDEVTENIATINVNNPDGGSLDGVVAGFLAQLTKNR